MSCGICVGSIIHWAVCDRTILEQFLRQPGEYEVAISMETNAWQNVLSPFLKLSLSSTFLHIWASGAT